jgi:hypothetical protein
MTKEIVFIQVHGHAGIREAEIRAAATLAEVHEVLKALGITIDSETLIFIDESEEHEQGASHEPVHRLKRGCRIHVSRCKRIKTMVHYLEKTAEKDFPPGARVQKVKDWAVHEFKLTGNDAAEHVLELCGSKDRPAVDTPLHQLVHGHDCHVCFDLVPTIRVEG